ncbi:PQQ-dependent sugar dehydrogenase [Dawidia soli]|uniref:Sorbosone dehydrogenase family protein n=1 Tax=Dawidia soli TaxID=2782352 RepID=A0AAP2DDP1_9BACT|nr:PQQ-dependent sugar dehydrogenase [Dawidia soli]MBT1687492.1 sorbosone dehydrogenase family protein [Dawidia soli]
MKKYVLLFLSGMTFGLTQCSDKPGQSTTFDGPVITSEKQAFGVDTVATGLENPWGIAFLPDGRILVTERKGEIRIIQDGKLLEEKIENVPAVYANGQGGLLDIVAHPDYSNNGWIYLSYAKPGEGGGGTTIARTKLEGNAFTDYHELFSAQPFANSDVHFGSRIVFDGKGHIFFSSGERGTKMNAQKLSNHLGKVLRLNEDGTVPTDNPFVGIDSARSEIWSYGHRNPQGLVYDAATETLWDVEHGPKGGDELNKVEKGRNYGWPVITYGINYDGTPITDITAKEGMEQPVHYWVPSIATCGLVRVSGEKYPGWKGNFLVGALALTHVHRVEVSAENKSVHDEKLLDKIGRVRAVVQSADGFLYVATESPGMILKIIPQ